jgi:hypothetical protein
MSTAQRQLQAQHVEMGSGAMIYISSFIEIVSGIRKLMGRYIHIHTDGMEIA